MYKRVLIKASGEVLLGKKNFGIDCNTLLDVSNQIKYIYNMGVQVAVVIGGGNIFRGIDNTSKNMDRSTADYMGMLATVMNALAFQDSLEALGISTRVQSALNINSVAEPFIKRRAIRHLEKNRVVIFAAGTGNPYFTTDTAGALRAIELNADLFIKATKVDGVFNKDPEQYKDAVKYEKLSYQDFIVKDLKVMDQTAVTLCKSNALPILIVNLLNVTNVKDAILGKKVGTLII